MPSAFDYHEHFIGTGFAPLRIDFPVCTSSFNLLFTFNAHQSKVFSKLGQKVSSHFFVCLPLCSHCVSPSCRT